MRAQAIVRELLNAHAGTTALVGARIWGGVAQQDVEPPLVIYRLVGSQPDEGMEPASVSADTAVEAAQIEVVHVARTYEELLALGEQIRLALCYQRGAVAGQVLLGVFKESEGPEEYDPQRDEYFQARVFRVLFDGP
jgi:hypothetical protein